MVLKKTGRHSIVHIEMRKGWGGGMHRTIRGNDAALIPFRNNFHKSAYFVFVQFILPLAVFLKVRSNDEGRCVLDRVDVIASDTRSYQYF